MGRFETGAIKIEFFEVTMIKHGRSRYISFFSSDQTGAALLVIVFTIVVTSVLSVGIMRLTTTSTQSGFFVNQQNRAFYLAESGARYTLPIINNDYTQAVATLNGKEFQLGGNDKFQISFDFATRAPNVVVVSTGIANAGTAFEAKQTVRFELEGTSLFQYGLFALSGDRPAIEAKGHGYIDYYNSSDGPYAGLPALHAGKLMGANRKWSETIKLKDDMIVYGDAYIGPGGHLPSGIKIENHAVLKGSKMNLPETKSYPPITGSIGGSTNLGDIRLDHHDTRTLTTGSYIVDDLEIDDHAYLTIAGDVVIYLTDDLEMKGDDCAIYLNDGATLTIYATTYDWIEIKIKGKGVINQYSQPKAEHFQIYGSYKCYKVETNLKTSNGDAKSYAVIHAPYAEVKFMEDTQFFGAAIGRKIKVEHDAVVHWDKALLSFGGSVVVNDNYIQY